MKKFLVSVVALTMAACGPDFSPTAVDQTLGDELKIALSANERPPVIITVDENFRYFFSRDTERVLEDLIGSPMISMGFGVIVGRDIALADSLGAGKYMLDVTVNSDSYGGYSWRYRTGDRVRVGIRLSRWNKRGGYRDVLTSFTVTTVVSTLFRNEDYWDATIRVTEFSILKGLERLAGMLGRPRKFTKTTAMSFEIVVEVEKEFE